MDDLKVTQVTDGLTVSPQPRPEDFPLLAARGVTLIVNNRPDGEEPGQLPAAEAAKLAAANGMGYRHIPVKLPDLSDDDIRKFAEALAWSEGPVHAHCRTGLRSVTLWVIDQVESGQLSLGQAQATIQSIGFDPKPALAWLSAHHVGSPA